MVILTKVRFIPEMKRNLISLGTLEALGCKYSSEDGVLRIFRGERVLLHGRRHETLYFLCEKGKDLEAGTCNEVSGDDTHLWHSRMGHISQRGLNVLVERRLLNGKKVSTLSFCEDCVYGKTHRLKFPTGKHISVSILDYIHTDLWGSSYVPKSHSGCQYFLSITDDHSRKVWVDFLRSKDQAFEKFDEWRIMVENQTGKKIKKLRSDNGLEFCNYRFDSMCKENGIVRHKTIAYTPQQNGVVERMNRSVMDKVRSMLSESGLSKQFWAEAAATAVHLINKSPSTAIGDKIPDEVWYNKDGLDYSYLRRFGCVAYVHSDDGKLNPRAKKGVFVGYPDGVKGYKIWLLDEEKCVLSRNVVFKEDLLYKSLVKKSKKKVEIGESSRVVELEINSEVTDTETGVDESLSDTERDAEVDVSQDDEEEESPVLQDYLLARDRVRREIQVPLRFTENHCVVSCLLTTNDGESAEPYDYADALKDKDWEKWNASMGDEMFSLEKNGTWVVVPKPKNVRVIGNKWVYTKKEGILGVEPPRFKSRLVAKGYSQREGIDYNEIFAPVVKHVSIRILLQIVAAEDLELEQLDVKTAFLHGELVEKIYMKQPEGYEIEGKEDWVCLLKKSLYGLKQSPRQWNKKFNDFMIGAGFKRGDVDSCVYVKQTECGSYVYLLLYVDDMLVASKSMQEINNLKKDLSSVFKMKDLGPAKKILGMEIRRDRKLLRLELSQEGYVEKVLKAFQMDKSKPVKTPMGVHFKLKSATDKELREQWEVMKYVPYANAVGSVMYMMIGTRPDIAYAVGMVSRFMGNPI